MYVETNLQASFTDDDYGYMLTCIFVATDLHLKQMVKQHIKQTKSNGKQEEAGYLLFVMAVTTVLAHDYREPSTVLSENEDLKHLESLNYEAQRLFWFRQIQLLSIFNLVWRDSMHCCAICNSQVREVRTVLAILHSI